MAIGFAVSRFRKTQTNLLDKYSSPEAGLQPAEPSTATEVPAEVLDVIAPSDRTSVHKASQESPEDDSAIIGDARKKSPLRDGLRFANGFAVVFVVIGILTGLSYYVDFRAGGSSRLSAGSFKVWTQEVYLDPTATASTLVLNIQSRIDAPVILTGVSVNDDPKCFPEYGQSGSEPIANAMNGMMEIVMKAKGINVLRDGYSRELRLGQVEKLSLGSPSFGACSPVKVVITTDSGSSTFNFE